MNTMTGGSRRRRTGLKAIGAAVGAVAFATTLHPSAPPAADLAADLSWRAVIVVAGITSAVLARRRNRIHVAFVAMIVLAAIRMATIDVRDLAFSVREATWPQASGDLVVGPLLLGTLILMLRVRRGRLGWRELIDGTSVALGAGLVAWIAIANPAWEHGVELPLAVAAATSVPIAFMFVNVTAELLLDGLTRNRAMWMLLGATIVNLVASIARSGFVLDDAAPAWTPVVVTAYATAFLLGCASMCHPHAPAIVRRREHATLHPRLEVLRLVPFAIALAMVGILGTRTTPTSEVDRAVQAVFVLATIVAVLARLYAALNASFSAQIRLERRLHTDELTGLPNRNMLVQIVAQQLDERWHTGARPTLVHVSIDRFKQLNDALGHTTANRLLISIGERLNVLASSTGTMVARTGGDEFMLLADATRSTDDALRLVEDVEIELARPFTIEATPIFVTASVGVALAPAHRSVSAEELVQHANIATHRAKAAGRNRVVYFDESMQEVLAHRVDVEHALHEALARRELLLFHQPIVDIADGHLTGFEALIRWRRADGSLVSPAEFIPIAEETGLINEIGAWALREALSQLASWIADEVVPVGTTMSVNVSPRQITDPRFAEIVAEAIEITGVPPHQLWLEMTESMMLQEPDLALTTLRRIRSMGVRMALDDFGTGYSSLSMLQRFPIQRIKIDRAFVQGLADRGNDRSLVRTIVAMGQSLGLDLVAEGVETSEQLRALRELGCERAQGFLISRPVPVEAVASTVAALADAAAIDLFGVRDVGSVASPDGRVNDPSTPSYRPFGGAIVTVSS